MNIPKVIHYCWFGHNVIPEDVRRCINSWHKFCPDFEIKQWDESNFDINLNQYVKEAYEAKKWAFVADFARLWIISHEGGVYLDTDVELIKPLTSILEQTECVVSEEIPGRINTGVGFAASAYHPVVESMLRQYENIHFLIKPNVYDLTPCPVRNTHALKMLGYTGIAGRLSTCNCVVLPPEIMSPINPETGKKQITAKTVSIHHFSGSWKNDEEKALYAKKMKLQHRYGRLGSLIYYLQVFYRKICTQGIRTTLIELVQRYQNKVDERQ